MKRKVTWEIDGEEFEVTAYTNSEFGGIRSVLKKLREKSVIEEFLVEEIK